MAAVAVAELEGNVFIIVKNLSPSHPLTLSPSHPLTPSPPHPLTLQRDPLMAALIGREDFLELLLAPPASYTPCCEGAGPGAGVGPGAGPGLGWLLCLCSALRLFPGLPGEPCPLTLPALPGLIVACSCLSGAVQDFLLGRGSSVCGRACPSPQPRPQSEPGTCRLLDAVFAAVKLCEPGSLSKHPPASQPCPLPYKARWSCSCP